ncbi:Ribose import ATP-binding protein RbsA [Botrimarina colliarenosi]|uniref:Ribose import ATP-binding protein RbsA n=1 Tax=Botrimarina colliarenosi TaxID=2528001 RepID=A0A5C6AE55_9BACT|nr:sugar ABC transporter ATP-binding protein [Botrimarina colliarenosi]TWT97687.1 Ribose import ATP-binding protein RbsA [Botrimarina colliarenosi]
MTDASPTPPPAVVSSAPLLEARGIVKTFPGVRALDGAGIQLRPGRLNALMGENGAGKSTLMNILAGVFAPDEGEVLLDGAAVQFRTPLESQQAGIAIIHQELNLADNLSVAENLFLGREPRGTLGLVDRGRMRREAGAILERVGLRIEPNQKVGELSVATQQVIEIGKALSQRSRVLILDEPTSALTAQETETLFRLIGQLKAEGVALAYITHRFDELDEIADDVTVFRDGSFVCERPFAGLSRPELIRHMIGRDAPVSPAATATQRRETVLSVRNLTLRRASKDSARRVDRCSFVVGRGEVVGLFGLMGAGRTELLEAIFGVHPQHTSGLIAIDGVEVAIRSPLDAYRAGLALTPEDRKGAGLILGGDVTENVTLACLDRFCRFGLIDEPARRRLTQSFADRLRLRTPSLRQPVRLLSGGNQQKVVLAKQLATQPKVLLLDEPTRGIDVGAKHEVYQLIRELADDGLAVLVVSSEAPEVLAMADRVLVMCEGRLTAEFARGAADEQQLLTAAFPDTSRRRIA